MKKRLLIVVSLLLVGCQSQPKQQETKTYGGEYGLSKDNPIMLGSTDEYGGPKAERMFLEHLTDNSGKTYQWRRMGSFGFGPDKHIVDGYSSEAGFIYIDMYHPEIPPLKARPPRGFTLR
jgi:hypothetical protein